VKSQHVAADGTEFDVADFGGVGAGDQWNTTAPLRAAISKAARKSW